MCSTFDVFDWAFIEISIKDGEILVFHLKSWYLGWNTLKFWKIPPNSVHMTHYYLILSRLFLKFQKFWQNWGQKFTLLVLWSTISKISLISSKISAQISVLHQMFMFFHDFMLVLQVCKIIIKAFYCCICHGLGLVHTVHFYF